MILGCYRKGDAADPETYVAAVAAVLSKYPKVIIDYVADPRTGIVTTKNWLPSVAEIHEACEGHHKKTQMWSGLSAQRERQIKEREDWIKAHKGGDLSKYRDENGNWVHSNKAETLDSRIGKRPLNEDEKAAALERAEAAAMKIATMKLMPKTLEAIGIKKGPPPREDGPVDQAKPDQDGFGNS